MNMACCPISFSEFSDDSFKLASWAEKIDANTLPAIEKKVEWYEDSTILKKIFGIFIGLGAGSAGLTLAFSTVSVVVSVWIPVTFGLIAIACLVASIYI